MSDPIYERIITAQIGRWRCRLWLKAGSAGVAIAEHECRKLALGVVGTMEDINGMIGLPTAYAISDITRWNAANGEPIAAAEVTDTRTGDGNIFYAEWP